MTLRNLLAAMAVFALQGCAVSVHVQNHGANAKPATPPKRMFIVNSLTNANDGIGAISFETQVLPALARCGITAKIYRQNAIQLDAETKLAAAITGFNADTILNGTQVVMDRYSVTYRFALQDVSSRRSLWTATVTASWAGNDERKRDLGIGLADTLVRTMSTDNVLGACVPGASDR